ncbi:hypothetical protein M758_9G182000 [Ceratodon purpureus]|nr:hypothetical protein M758_9G182000 [Ceratodon purpureus]
MAWAWSFTITKEQGLFSEGNTWRILFNSTHGMNFSLQPTSLVIRLASTLPASQFTIHGLWPMHVGGTSPCFCRPPYHPDDLGTSRRDVYKLGALFMTQAES